MNRHTRGRRVYGRWYEVKIHAIVAAAVASSLILAQPRVTLVVGGVVCTLTYAYIGLREARKTSLWLSPLSFYFLWYVIGMGLSPVYVGLTTESGGSVRFISERSQVLLDDLAVGYVIYLVGSLVLHLGMQITRPRLRPATDFQFDRNLVVWFSAIWLGGLLFQLSPATFSFLGASTRILAFALVGSVCGFAITGRDRLGLSRLQFIILLLLGTAGLFFGNLASGSKAYIMYSFLPITWLFMIRRRLRAWIPVLALCLAAFYFVVVAPVVHTSRLKPVAEGESPRGHMIESFDSWMKEKPEELDQSFFADQIDQFLNRQFDAVPVGFMVGEVKREGLMLGETMKYASYAFIPRILWPEKPSVSRGGWFTYYLGFSETEAEATTATAMTATGELYWNYGIMGVLVGMLGIGLAHGGIWRMAGSDPRGKPVHMLLYVSLLLAIPDMAEAVTVFALLAVTYLTFKAVFFGMTMVGRTSRTRKRRRPALAN